MVDSTTSVSRTVSDTSSASNTVPSTYSTRSRNSPSRSGSRTRVRTWYPASSAFSSNTFPRNPVDPRMAIFMVPLPV